LLLLKSDLQMMTLLLLLPESSIESLQNIEVNSTGLSTNLGTGSPVWL
jgi:hypothetical protein